MIDIYLNGKLISLAEKMSLKKLLEKQGVVMGTVAVAVNETVIPGINYEKIIIQPGDRIEIITAMCGG
ncbi:sulfur carrier protein ThiS [Coxiella burnetii]|uniref:ThiS n=1 Tax=Coxiella burnetii (strain RSA 493 / Nine Mile phase I) TaxID=227377 RepID=Q83EI8_COXBU|nr:sulfur carrier protein ThiS [Coxiella burnetii]NP_819374.1 sulfur carrier protein ThiS [Coxiella burnetii RSA 493]AAO89888.1 ThiS [Coxiella burnetii RSA 493]ACJ18954.1 ThiS [Coxiella burnetii CbuG_Q212]ACJ19807.1 ThiS [Coxiella burnetii CbuK_Q154]AIT62824.1 Thiamine biosynthesis protein ThiS [Coxiella burnetii str. Namibia]AML49682.1 thiamine biosynthesis protein ThiS [Coxiella burnetii]